MSVVQPYQRTVGTDGLGYMKARGRVPVPYIPQVPVLTKHSLLTRFHARNNGVITPPIGGGGGGNLGDGVAVRDSQLVSWYGKLGDVGSPYTLTGPTKDQVGVVDTYASLPDLNPSNTEDTTVTTTLTISNGKWHGRIKLSGNGKVIATNVIFDGPATPSNTSIFSGETAIIDGNSAGIAQSYCKDCTFYMKVPHPRFNAHKGSRMKLERCHIFWVTDGIGPYTTPGQTFPTAFEMVASRVEKLYYWPGPYFANRSPAYWNGTTYQSGTAGAFTRSANGTASDRIGFFDDQHPDGNHSDCCEIHSGYGTHVFNPTSQLWSGDGIHIWGNSMICDDAYGAGNPSNLAIPVPLLGYGDNPKRGLTAGGQLPGMARPQTSWNKPTAPGKYAANGVSMYIGHVVGPAFPSITTVVVHGNYFVGGNMGMQEQKKTQTFIQFNFYDNHFGPDFYMWNAANTNDMYPVRLNDYTTQNAMPDFVAGPVRIPRHPVTNAPVFGAGASNIWVGAQAKFGIADGTGVGVGSSSVPGIRVI